MLLALWTLLAEGDAPQQGPGLGPLAMPLLIMMAFVVFIYLPMRREKKARQEMMSAIDKGDKVVVNGAFVAVVTQVEKGDEKDPDDKLVVKIDENANIKMRVLRSSVTRVYKKDAKDG